jgi:hypothetical protein
MHIGAIRSAGLDHFPDDFEQPLARAAQGAGVAHPLLPFFLVVGIRPRRGVACAIGPQMDDVAQDFAALAANFDFVDLAGLVRRRDFLTRGV